MKIAKLFIAMAVICMTFKSECYAEVVVMSIQQMRREADAIVVGEILESHNTGKESPIGRDHWLATCRVERYIKGPKIHKVDVEEAKAVSLISIAFVQAPMQIPQPIKLTEGKKYLLFLKETESPNQYEMITPYHGAFEAGQNHDIYDEQNPSGKLSFEEIVQRISPQSPDSVDIDQQSERELSEDELRMKERLIALSRGEGDVADLRIEFMDGNPMTLTGMRIYNIADGKVVSQEWASIGSPEKRGERAVTDEETRQLLRTLIEHRYWTFQGTQFIPDASGFMFRFHYKDLPPVEYRCEAHEYEASAQLSEIRSVWLSFVSGTPPQNPVPSQPAQQVKLNQPLMLTINADKQVYEVGEEIWIDFKFKNVSEKPIELLIIETEFPQYHDFEFFDSKGNRISPGDPESNTEELRRVIKREEIVPGHEFVSKVPLHKWELAGLGHPATNIGSEARKIFIKGIYFTPVGIQFADPDKLFFGTLTSNTIAIEVVEKGKAGLPREDGEVDIREQLDAATGYWYAYFREKMLGEGRALRSVRQEGEWTVAESFGRHGFTPFQVLTRFLGAEETKIQGLVMVLGNIKSLLRSSIDREVEEGIREIGILSSKDDICLSPEQCLKWIEGYEDYVFWDEEGNILSIAKEARMANFGRAVRGLALSFQTDKTTYKQNEPIILTARLENILPASGAVCAVFPINARMLIHSEIVFDVRNEKGEYVHFLPPSPAAPLTAEDFKQLDGGQFIESQEEITSRFHEKPLAPGLYRIRATYQNYELGKALGLAPSCAGGSVLLEGGPAWTGKLFSNTITVKIE